MPASPLPMACAPGLPPNNWWVQLRPAATLLDRQHPAWSAPRQCPVDQCGPAQPTGPLAKLDPNGGPLKPGVTPEMDVYPFAVDRLCSSILSLCDRSASALAVWFLPRHGVQPGRLGRFAASACWSRGQGEITGSPNVLLAPNFASSTGQGVRSPPPRRSPSVARVRASAPPTLKLSSPTSPLACTAPTFDECLPPLSVESFDA